MLNKNKTVFLILGKSGSGKTTLVNILEEKYHLRVLRSYTTRRPRPDNINDHIYITLQQYYDFPKDEIIAETYFNDNYYFATKQQYNNSDLYVIDAQGVEYLKQFNDLRPFKAIFLECPDDILKQRLLKRDNNLDRFYHDQKSYIIPTVDYTIAYNEDFNETVNQVIKIINEEGANI